MKYAMILFFIDLCLCSTIQSTYRRQRSLMKNQDLYNQSCNKNEPDYKLPNENISLTHYTKSFTDYKSSHQLVLNIFLEGTMGDFTGFVMNIPISIIFFCLCTGIFLIWILMWYLWCCKCCIFNPKRKASKIGYVFYVLSITLFFGIFASSIYSFDQSNKLPEGMNGSACSLMSFFDDMLNGDKSLTIPRWSGLIPLQNTMAKASNLLNDVETERKKIYDANYYIDKIDNDNGYKSNIEELLQLPTVVQDPNKYSGTINTVYGLSLSLIHANSSLNKILNENNEGLEKGILALESLDLSSAKINPNLVTIRQALSDIQQELTDFSELINNMGDRMTTSYSIFLDLLSQYYILSFEVINGVNLSFACISIIVLSIYVWAKIEWLKYGLYFLWNLMMLLSILSLIIGSLLIVLGNIGYEMIPGVNQIFSTDYLKSSAFDKKNKALFYLETCVNGNGDLAEALGLKDSTSAFKFFYEYYNSTIKIHNAKKNLKITGNAPNAIDAFIEEIQEYQKDLRSTAPDDYNRALKNAERICPGKTFLLPTKEQCIEFKDCYCIDDPIVPLWSTLNSEPCVNEISIIKTSIIENKENLNKILLSTEELQANQQITVFNNISGKINLAVTMTQTFKDILYPNIGENDLYELFNCKKIRIDLIIFLDQINSKYATVSVSVGLGCAISGFFGFVGVFFFILTIYYFSASSRIIVNESKGFDVNNSVINEKSEVRSEQKIISQKIEIKPKKIEEKISDIKQLHKEFEINSLRSNVNFVDTQTNGSNVKQKPVERFETSPQ